MADIIDISGKKGQKSREEFRQKLEATRRIFLCSGCPSKCAKCGTHLEGIERCSSPSSSEHHLCDACRSEWETYQKLQRGETANALYYHNTEWIRLWEAWIDYQRALTNYRNSKEFQRLLLELEL